MERENFPQWSRSIMTIFELFPCTHDTDIIKKNKLKQIGCMYNTVGEDKMSVFCKN